MTESPFADCWMKGVLTFSKGHLVVVPIGIQFTEEETKTFEANGVITLESYEYVWRRVLEEKAIDVTEILSKYVGSEVQVLLRYVGVGLTRGESDVNLLTTRPNDAYVVWSSPELPFVCLDGFESTDRREASVVYGPPATKLEQLDEECSCSKRPHHYVLARNKVSAQGLEALIVRVLVNGEPVSV